VAKPRIAVIDNYDSFVYNLVQLLGELGACPLVRRNDALDVAELAELHVDGLLVSPGPGRPEDAGISKAAIATLGGTGIPTLGVCLGHQCIGQLFGATIVPAPELLHGKTSMIEHDRLGFFAGMTSPFRATRYHSLTVDPASLSSPLIITARSEDGTIMGVRHASLPIEGVQFHPESVLTEGGRELLANFVQAVELRR
jgi:anthranilate synthase/aminodeoxychorismate synthase-like glutamine amidotransferase